MFEEFPILIKNIELRAERGKFEERTLVKKMKEKKVYEYKEIEFKV